MGWKNGPTASTVLPRQSSKGCASDQFGNANSARPATAVGLRLGGHQTDYSKRRPHKMASTCRGLLIMEWSGRAPAPPASQAGLGAAANGAPHAQDGKRR